MRARGALLLTVGALALSIAISCSGGHGGGGGPTPDPTPDATPAGCDTAWRANDPAYASDMLATLVPGGSAVVSNGTLVLSWNGTLPASGGTDGRFSTGALFSKRVLTRNFDVSVRYDSLAATGTNLAMFFGVQSAPGGAPHGLRFLVEQIHGGETFLEHDWYGGPPAVHGGGSPQSEASGAFRFQRIDSVTTLVNGSAGSDRSSGTNFDPSEPETTVIGFGIFNPEAAPATGSFLVRFRGLAVTDTAQNCYATGLD